MFSKLNILLISLLFKLWIGAWNLFPFGENRLVFFKKKQKTFISHFSDYILISNDWIYIN